jgi:hypothetical protein
MISEVLASLESADRLLSASNSTEGKFAMFKHEYRHGVKLKVIPELS